METSEYIVDTSCLLERGYRVKSRLGQESSEGRVYLLCRNSGDCSFVAKLWNKPDHSVREQIKVAQKAGEREIGPKIFDVLECTAISKASDKKQLRVPVMIMDDMNSTYADLTRFGKKLTQTQIDSLIGLFERFLKARSVAHDDINRDNVMFKNDRAYLIDFSSQRQKKFDKLVAMYRWADRYPALRKHYNDVYWQRARQLDSTAFFAQPFRRAGLTSSARSQEVKKTAPRRRVALFDVSEKKSDGTDNADNLTDLKSLASSLALASKEKGESKRNLCARINRAQLRKSDK